MPPRPRELRRPRPTERRSPLSEPNDPLALERCYADQPEGWDEATLTAAVELQRVEREARLTAKARKTAKIVSHTTLAEEVTHAATDTLDTPHAEEAT